MVKALCIPGTIALCLLVSASSARAQETQEFRFVPELPRFQQASPLRIDRASGTLRLGNGWQLAASRESFRPTDTMRMRYEDLYFERALTDRVTFQVGATRFKHREHERSYRDVTYAVRWTVAF